MPGNWPNITNLQTADATRRNGQAALPAPGSVVMAGVEEDHGDGVYTIRWGGNRLTVASQAKLTPGSTLILKAELSPEGKTMLVVQGPAFPGPNIPVVAANYGPPRQVQESSQTREPPPGEAGAGEEASASGGVLRTDGGTPAGAVLKPLLAQLPDVFRHSEAILEAAVADLERLFEKTAEKAQGERGDRLPPEGGGQEKKPPVESSGDPGKQPAEKAPDATTIAKTLEALKEAALRLAAAEGASPEVRPASRPPSGEGAPVEARPLPASVAELPPPPAANAGGARPETPPVAGQPASPPPASPGDGSSAPPPQTGATVVPEARPMPVPATGTPPVPVSDAGQGGPARPDAPAPDAPSPPPTSSASPSQAAGAAAVPEARPMPAPATGTPPVPVSDAGQSGPARPDAPPGQASAAPPPAADQISRARLPEEGFADALRQEALHQLAKTAELPLGGGVAEIAVNSGGRGSTPAAVVDKAASILLTAAGLTPGPATLEAAKALMEQNAPVERNSVQLMLSLAAGTEGPEREATLKAAARLIAHDVPVSQSLVSGLADVLSREAGIAKLSAAADMALAGPVGIPEVKPFAEAARELLALLSVDLESEGASSALERFVSSFGRETLARALSMVEAAAQAALEAHPDLPKIDAALTEVLARLSGGDASARPDPAGTPADGEAASLPDADGARPEPGSGTAAQAPGRTGDAATLPAPAPGPLPHPGANAPAIELFRPGGPVEKFLTDARNPADAGKRPAAMPDGRDVDKAASDLLSDAPDRRRQAMRDLVNRDQPFLREIASRLVEAERSAMRSAPLLARLAEAANSLRELGRQLVAVKAENIAGQDRNPGVMLAEVPLRMGDSGGDGRMQMFYRKGGSAKGGWSSRVILDLNTSVLGPVLGDMRFSGKDMTLNMFVDKKETADFLALAGGELADKLQDKGFRLKTRFLVLPPPAAGGQPEQPRRTNETAPRPPSPPAGARTRRGRLDTKA